MSLREQALAHLIENQEIDFDSFPADQQERMIESVMRMIETSKIDLQQNPNQNASQNPDQNPEDVSDKEAFEALTFFLFPVIFWFLGSYTGNAAEDRIIGILLSALGNTLFISLAICLVVGALYLFSCLRQGVLTNFIMLGPIGFIVGFAISFDFVNVPEKWQADYTQLFELNIEKAREKNRARAINEVELVSWSSQYDEKRDAFLVSLEIYNGSQFTVTQPKANFWIGEAMTWVAPIGPPITPYSVETWQLIYPGEKLLKRILPNYEDDKVDRLNYLSFINTYRALSDAGASTTAGLKLTSIVTEEFDRNAEFQKEALAWLELE